MPPTASNDSAPRDRRPLLRVRMEQWKAEDPGDLEWTNNLEMPAVPRAGDYVEFMNGLAIVESVNWTPFDEDVDVVVVIR